MFRRGAVVACGVSASLGDSIAAAKAFSTSSAKLDWRSTMGVMSGSMPGLSRIVVDVEASTCCASGREELGH